jgi:DNA-binding FadR family transcriptional regulator
MNRYQTLLQELEDFLAGDDLLEGGRLPPERELSEKLGVGRRLLRRALGELEEKGLISRRQGRGTFAIRAETGNEPARVLASPDTASLYESANPIELIELRFLLEPTMARLAALRSSRLDVTHLFALAKATREATNHKDYQTADAAFHRRIAELSHNKLFLSLYEGVSEALRDTALERFGENGHCFKRQANHAGFHEAIVQAIAERDGDRAHALMLEHLSDVHQSLFINALPQHIAGRPAEAAE